MQTHMQTQAKSTLVCFHTTKMYAEACTHQNTHRRRHSNSPPGIICINRSSAGAVQPTCLCIFFSFWVLNNSCLAPVDLSVCYCLSVAFSQPLSFLFLSQQLSSFALLHCLSFCLPFAMSHYHRGYGKKNVFPFPLLHPFLYFF